MSTSRLRLGRMSSRLAAVGAVGAIAVGVVACGSDSGASGSSGSSGGGGGGDKVVVGLITKTESNPFFVKMKEAAQKAAEAKQRDAASPRPARRTPTTPAQVTAIENMVTPGAKGILITPGDSKAIVPAIKKARDAGVTVIALDTPTEPQDAADALFATDNMKAGELIGEWAKAKFAKDGKQAKIVDDRPRPGHLRRRAAPQRLPEGLRRSPTTGGARPRRRERRPGQGAGGDGEPAPEGPGRQPRLHDQRAVGVRRLHRAEGGRQGEAGDASSPSTAAAPAIEKGIKPGVIAATRSSTRRTWPSSASRRRDSAKGEKVSGYNDTGVTLITDDPQDGVDSKDSTFGAANCWG